MASSDNGGDSGSFEGNTFFPAAAGSTIPTPKQVVRELNDNDLAFDSMTILVAIYPQLGEQLQ
ncbi:UNVERIFIED_CONTAM: hypothetical protein Sangu_0201000 [Sesamum angustifolium]|uniref:Uncharacterized protein n=1 Tax=Sesamum angustifolium TaxID=2727405 RepID=A0AAW2RMN1_9LAMI